MGRFGEQKMAQVIFYFFFFQAEDGIRDDLVTGVQTCALPISFQRITPEMVDHWVAGCGYIKRPRKTNPVAMKKRRNKQQDRKSVV